MSAASPVVQIAPNRADLVLIVLAALLIGALFARWWTPPTVASEFELRAGARLVGRYALNLDRQMEVRGPLGLTRVQVRDGRVRFIGSPCRNKICLHSGWLAHSGDAAACLPNRVSLSLLGEDGGRLDAVSF